jgi:general secretion pathway protein I
MGDHSLPLVASLGREKRLHSCLGRPGSFAPLSPLPSPLVRSSGFTLLEVLVAMVIVGLAVTAILELFSSNLRAISSSEDHMRASLAAEARMRDVLDGTGLAEKGWSEVTNEGYRIDVTINKVQTERANMAGVDLYQIDLALSWKRGMRDRTITLKTLKAVYRQNEDPVSS